MSRTVTVKLGATEWHMPVSWKASKEIAQVVEDPLTLAIKAERGELQFTTDLIVSLIYIGCKHAGCGLAKDDIGEAICSGESAPVDYLPVVAEYIRSLTMGGPEVPVKGGRKKKQSGG